MRNHSKPDVVSGVRADAAADADRLQGGWERGRLGGVTDSDANAWLMHVETEMQGEAAGGRGASHPTKTCSMSKMRKLRERILE